jgi:HD superfamily phosphohydrolase
MFFQLAEYGEARQNPTAVLNMHELVALDVLTCPKMQDYLQSILDLDVDWIRKIPHAIVGGIVNRRSFHEYLVTALVNGIFDCDKLDYIIRDSLYSGLPLPLDTERLVRMVKVVDVNGDPHFVVEQRGARSLDLLYRGRAFLYPTVYQHHTVRAFESMIIIGLLHAMKKKVEGPPGLHRIEHPLDLLFHDDATILNYFRISDSAFLKEIGNRILTRRHPRVAVEFTAKDLTSLSEMKLENRSPLIALYEIAKDPVVRHEFQQEVLNSCGKRAPDNLVKEIPSIAEASPEHMLDFTLPIDVLEAPGRKVYIDKYIESKGFFEKGTLVSLNDLQIPDPLQAAKGVSGIYGFRFYALPEIVVAVTAPMVSILNKKLGC